ncbi:MAG: hypothetical protein PHR06_14625, partial [Candidatus Cloacimonetes bacterium]|nr:hypothetical protein [Candidatus Cloacimonadota bacterium]
MPVIFLDFYSNLEDSSLYKNKNRNIFSSSLVEQFDLINNRLPLKQRFSDIRSFIENAFPSGLTKRYYISCPNYKRELVQGTSASFLHNVVLRADGAELSKKLSNNMSVILVGDIIEGG